MRTLRTCLVGLSMVLAAATMADAHQNDELAGLLVGGIGGAAIGHVITGTPEGVIIGSFLGGTIGVLAAGENDHGRVLVIRNYNRPGRHWPGYSDRGRRHHRQGWYPEGRNGYRDRWHQYPGRYRR